MIHSKKELENKVNKIVLLKGKVIKINYKQYRNDTTFYILRIITDFGAFMSVKINHRPSQSIALYIDEGDEFYFRGKLLLDPKYGYELSDSYLPIECNITQHALYLALQSTSEADSKPITSEPIARELSNKCPLLLYDVVLKKRTPDLSNVYNVKEKRFESIRPKLAAKFPNILFEAELFYAFPQDIMDYMDKMTKGDYLAVLKHLRSDPYEFLLTSPNFGFPYIDRLIQNMVKDFNEGGHDYTYFFHKDILTSRSRDMAAANYAINFLMKKDSSTLILRKDFDQKTRELLKRNLIIDPIKEKVLKETSSGNLVTSIQMYKREKFIAKTLTKMITQEPVQLFSKNRPSDNPINIKDEDIKKFYKLKNIEEKTMTKEDWIISELQEDGLEIDEAVKKVKKMDIPDRDMYETKVVNEEEWELTDKQKDFLHVFNDNNITVLRGYAGTGKTASMKALCNMLDYYKIDFTLCAPTGKAAKVLSAQTGREAHTIHRAIKAYVDDFGETNVNDFTKEDTSIEGVIIIDESSMMGVDILYFLLQTIVPSRTKIVFVGDDAQLPSVSPGNVFPDILNFSLIPQVALTEVLRQKATEGKKNDIPLVAEEIRQQDLSIKNNKNRRNYKFVDLQRFKNNDNVYKKVLSLYKSSLELTDSVDEIMVLTPYKSESKEFNTPSLNLFLQDKINKNGPAIGESKYFRVGDKVIFKRNTNEIYYFNEKGYDLVKNLDLDIIEHLESREGKDGKRTFKYVKKVYYAKGKISALQNIAKNPEMFEENFYIYMNKNGQLKTYIENLLFIDSGQEVNPETGLDVYELEKINKVIKEDIINNIPIDKEYAEKEELFDLFIDHFMDNGNLMCDIIDGKVKLDKDTTLSINDIEDDEDFIKLDFKTVFNGETGIITGTSNYGIYVKVDDGMEESYFHISFSLSERTETVFNRDSSKQKVKNERAFMDLAYALTVYKSQGSQAKYVIFVQPKSNNSYYSKGGIINSNSLYVAITRASEYAYHLCFQDDAENAARIRDERTRKTSLSMFFKQIERQRKTQAQKMVSSLNMLKGRKNIIDPHKDTFISFLTNKYIRNKVKI